ncbi:hypothetical protein TNCV_3510921 [Trichonephila clavipes]|nr:hypothetical protein TNCV_3510921 [Trichonephila clavipes]
MLRLLNLQLYHNPNRSKYNKPNLPTFTMSETRNLSEPISATAAVRDNSLNTTASSLSTETRPFPATSNKFAALSTEVQSSDPLLESAATTSNNEPSNASKITKCVKQNSKKKNRRRCPKVQKQEIEVKRAPHRPRKSAPTEYATDEEDMITYEVEEHELYQILRINTS